MYSNKSGSQMTHELSEEVENSVGKHGPGRCFILPRTMGGMAETALQLCLAVEIKRKDGVSTLPNPGTTWFGS